MDRIKAELEEGAMAPAHDVNTGSLNKSSPSILLHSATGNRE